MRKLLLILFTLLFSTLMFSSTSFADWKKITGDVRGNTYYVDFKNLKEHGGYVYFWVLKDYLKPDESGEMSGKKYMLVDCKILRFQNLSFSFHKEPMGKGTGDVQRPVKESQGWKYAAPDTQYGVVLNSVCAYAKLR